LKERQTRNIYITSDEVKRLFHRNGKYDNGSSHQASDTFIPKKESKIIPTTDQTESKRECSLMMPSFEWFNPAVRGGEVLYQDVASMAK
jgi:hypothetical protein